MSGEPPKCTDCGAMMYLSPNPQHKGKWEHFCAKTSGIVIYDTNFPKELTTEKTREFMEKKKAARRPKEENPDAKNRTGI